MRRIMATVLASAIGAWTAGTAFGQGAGAGAGARPNAPRNPQAAPTQGQPMDPPGAVPPRGADAQALVKQMDNLLRLWEEQSTTITTLDARFKREDVTKAWGTKELFWGRAILKSPDYAFLDFQKDEGDKKPPVPYEQIRCTGKDVYHYRSANHQIFVYPMPAQQQQRALQEGPLPFLFNMRAAEAKERYFMTLTKETLTFYVVQIKPKKQIDQEAFIQADIILDKQKFLPNAMRLYAPNGTDFQTYTFTGEGCYIKTNVAVNEKNFEGLVLKGWDVIRNPNADGRPPAANAVGAQFPPARGAPTTSRSTQVAPRR